MPCIAALPSIIPAGQVRDQAVHAMDWLPTIAEVCGVRLPDRKLDGRSIATVLRSSEAAAPHDVLHWQRGRARAVRQGKWKLVAEEVRGTRALAPPLDRALANEFLSNLATDVGESKNLAADQPELIARMRRLHDAWLAEVQSQ
jgi:arylsulfatase A-like enzyme